MKTLLKFALIGLIALGISRGVTYMIGAVQTQEQVKQVNQRADDIKSEPVVNLADAKTEFMKGCDNGELDGANFDQNAYCACTFDKVIQNHGVNKLIQTGLNGTDQDVQNLMKEEVEYCLAQQGY